MINEELSELYGNDPTAAMESYGLDSEQQDLLRDELHPGDSEPNSGER